MAILYSVNTLPASGAVMWYNLVVHLVSAGWTVKAAGDGLSAYSAADGTAITGSGTGANGFNNYKAWYRLRMPGTDSAPREFVIQRGTNATDCRIKYSAATAFTGGSPNSTTCATAVNEQIIVAGGTDALPTGLNFVGTINRASFWADNAAPYGFGAHGWSAAGATTWGIALESMVSGSYPAEDADPYTVMSSPNVATFGQRDTLASSAGSNAFGWHKYGLSGAVWVRMPAAIYTDSVGNIVAPNTASAPTANPYNGKDDEVPIAYARWPGSTTPGWKGFGKYARWLWLATRPNLTTLSTTGTKDRLVIGQSSWPWSGVDPSL